MSDQADAKSEFMAATTAKPVTMKGRILTELYNNGLFEDQAVGVFKQYEASEMGKPMNGRWNEATSALPPMMLNIVWAGVKKEAVKWIDANKPQHWARGLFLG